MIFSRASRQKAVSIMLDSRQDSAFRLAQSMIVAIYKNLFLIGM